MLPAGNQLSDNGCARNLTRDQSGEDVLRRINGIDLATGRTVDGYTSLKADGSTACGCWIYSGVYADEVNQAARRNRTTNRGRTNPSGAGPGR